MHVIHYLGLDVHHDSITLPPVIPEGLRHSAQSWRAAAPTLGHHPHRFSKQSHMTYAFSFSGRRVFM
jgi:hypothetical protein